VPAIESPSVEANGARIPLLGLGTWDLRGKSCARMVEAALCLGYRHIDTAAMYRNEVAVGEGLRASGVRRDEVFITTKVWSSDLRARDFERSTRESVENLKIRNVDLLLIHWPNSSVPLKETIGALCKMKREGLARHIGVSNFDPTLVADAVKLAAEPLVNNQIELHPYNDQSKTIAASRKAGLAITAYTPIARGRVAGDALLSRIGKAHGKTAAQVCLRYLVQQSIVVIPKTSRAERLKENGEIFDFQLTPAEMREIGALASPRGNIVS
jgi:diketogulonate reductase-like aldo/keto reductase